MRLKNPRRGQKTSSGCELCGRVGPVLTRHHLIPLTQHGNKRVRRHFSRRQCLEMILWVCRPCHSQIHLLFSTRRLADELNTRDALLAHSEIRRFVSWIQSKPAGLRPPMRTRSGSGRGGQKA